MFSTQHNQKRSRHQSPKRRSALHAFTLIEMLVVITIIAILMAISLAVFGNLATTAREKRTAAIITKINGFIEERLRAFDRLDLSRDIQTASLSMPLRIAEISVKKREYERRFPQRYDELGSEVGWGPAPAALPPEVENAEVLYHILTGSSVLGSPPASEDDFDAGSLSVYINPATGSPVTGRKYIVDGWGNPIRFYRWPTRLIRPSGAGSGPNMELVNLLLPGLASVPFNQDPNDPLDEFYNWYLGTSPTVSFETRFHTPGTFHVPLLISAGRDGELGLYEPTDVGSFGHLSQPDSSVDLTDPGNSVLNDNITNRQRGIGQ